MGLTVLSDSKVSEILWTLPAPDVSQLLAKLEDFLVRYSCFGEHEYQPDCSVVNRPGGQAATLVMPAASQRLNGCKIVAISPARNGDSKSKPGLKSALLLCDATGHGVGVLGAAALTAFRTSLGSMLLFQFRRNVANIVVFGAGSQALWHIQLALLLRGSDIKKITVVNARHNEQNS